MKKVFSIQMVAFAMTAMVACGEKVNDGTDNGGGSNGGGTSRRCNGERGHGCQNY